jgi:hypothetical protein
VASNDGYYEVFWPRAPRQMQQRALAPRLDSLAGKTIAQLWDQLFKGDLVFDLLEKGIRARLPEVRFVSWREFGSTHGDEEKEALAALPQRFKERPSTSSSVRFHTPRMFQSRSWRSNSHAGRRACSNR